MSGRVVARAPGKAMLFGEYAVVNGAPALVAAVDRYATAYSTSDHGLGSSPFVREARAAVIAEYMRRGSRPRLAGLRIDSSPLYASGAGGRKLGLGSSAAVTAVAVGEWPDLPREAVWRMCQEAHCRAQGSRGSGADLAAAIWGGVLRFQLVPDWVSSEGCAAQPISLSPDLAVTLVDTGVEAATAPRLARLAALQQNQPERYQALMRPLHQLAEVVADEAQASGTIAADAVHEWNDVLDALAAALEVPIVTEAHRAIAACAIAVGGSAKPSGAGGGDLAVCFTPVEATAGLRARLLHLGFEPLDLTVGARGLHRAQDPDDADDITVAPTPRLAKAES
jgi:phosphomevalonate kinase